jgi:hypothetical protein
MVICEFIYVPMQFYSFLNITAEHKSLLSLL